MELIDRAIFFNSTILVFWTVLLVPYALKHRKYWILGLSGAILIPFESYLLWGLRSYPYNVLLGTLYFFLALGGGYVMHFSNLRNERKSEK